jgi:oligopeptide/dipeptide ABC transporter ATP-binding protein
VGIAGESGSGKSAAIMAALRLPPHGWHMSTERHLLGGIDVRRAPERTMRNLRGRFAAVIFQDPLSALNPLLPAGTQVAEVFVRHGGFTKRAAQAKALDLLARVGIADAMSAAGKYPHELSAGQLQRVMIAAALAGEPSLLIADDPTTALDVTLQADLARLITQLHTERQMGLVWVSHDLALLAGVVDRVVVMYAGRIMEMAPVGSLYRTPRHPYTVALLESLPRLDKVRGPALDGAPPDPAAPQAGCPFAPRCAWRTTQCDEPPPLLEIGDSLAACWAHL